jgi:Zn-dependent alcohol dehydrogenase
MASSIDPYLLFLGHEGSGEVVEVGSEVRLVCVGDRVVCSWTPACGGFFFAQDQPILCQQLTLNNPKGYTFSGARKL